MGAPRSSAIILEEAQNTFAHVLDQRLDLSLARHRRGVEDAALAVYVGAEDPVEKERVEMRRQS